MNKLDASLGILFRVMEIHYLFFRDIICEGKENKYTLQAEQMLQDYKEKITKCVKKSEAHNIDVLVIQVASGIAETISEVMANEITSESIIALREMNLCNTPPVNPECTMKSAYELKIEQGQLFGELINLLTSDNLSSAIMKYRSSSS